MRLTPTGIEPMDLDELDDDDDDDDDDDEIVVVVQCPTWTTAVTTTVQLHASSATQTATWPCFRDTSPHHSAVRGTSPSTQAVESTSPGGSRPPLLDISRQGSPCRSVSEVVYESVKCRAPGS